MKMSSNPTVKLLTIQSLNLALQLRLAAHTRALYSPFTFNLAPIITLNPVVVWIV